MGLQVYPVGGGRVPMGWSVRVKGPWLDTVALPRWMSAIAMNTMVLAD